MEDIFELCNIKYACVFKKKKQCLVLFRSLSWEILEGNYNFKTAWT